MKSGCPTALMRRFQRRPLGFTLRGACGGVGRAGGQGEDGDG